MIRQNLGHFQLACLAAVFACGDQAYAPAVRKHLEGALTPSRRVAQCQVNQALDRLQQIGLLASYYQSQGPLPWQRRRRCFQITDAGQNSLLKIAIRTLHGIAS